MSDLTPKQERFVAEYLRDLNATQAAIRAGYSRKNAGDQAAQLMAKPEIAAAIDAAKIGRMERTEIDADWVLFRLAEEANADIADLFDPETNAVLPVHEWPLIFRQGIVTGLEAEELYAGEGEEKRHVGRVTKLKFSDRLRRLELIGRHINVSAFKDVIEVRGLTGLAERLERAQKRTDVVDVVRVPVPVPSLLPGNMAVSAAAAAPVPAESEPTRPVRPVVHTPPPSDWERATAYVPVLPLREASTTIATTDYDPFNES